MTKSRERLTSNLLALRDGEPTDSADSEALLNDPEHRSALAKLEAIKRSLNELPAIDPGDALLQQILEASGSAPAVAELPTQRYRPAHVPFAMAAGLLLTLAITIVVLIPGREDPTVELSGLHGQSGNLAQLYARSRQLEPLVRNVRLARRDPTARALLYRIADLDAQLNGYSDAGLTLPDQENRETEMRQQELQKLWGQRVALLESLAQVRRTRAVLQPAVY